uniref:F-box/LRR-repeat protein n=1 Tax=Elaeophora elaphi TaxID=1147741 RepID=A0A0R3S2M8_9BILA
MTHDLLSWRAYVSCHPILLDKNDEFLSALLKPLADVNDNLDDDEIDKLPLQLQYYEGHRCQEPLITNKIVESLYLDLPDYNQGAYLLPLDSNDMMEVRGEKGKFELEWVASTQISFAT